MNTDTTPPTDTASSFELSFRFMSNELIGLRVTVDDFKTKWIILTMIMLGGISALAANYGPSIKTLMAG